LYAIDTVGGYTAESLLSLMFCFSLCQLSIMHWQLKGSVKEPNMFHN